MWILTEEYNEYDQYGAYFVDAWHCKPSEEDLKNAGVHPSDIQHVLNGGGRTHRYEGHWYNLFKHK